MVGKMYVKHCPECDKATYHIGVDKYDSSKDNDYMLTICVSCNANGYANKADVFGIYLHENDVIGTVFLPASEEISLQYSKQDIFYLLSMFSNSNYVRGTKSKGFMDWSFKFRLPETNISFNNSKGAAIKIHTSSENFNKDDFNKNLDVLLTYIVDYCEEREPGFIKNMLLIRSISPDTQARLEEIHRYFDKFNRKPYTSPLTGTTGSVSSNTRGGYTISPLDPQILSAVSSISNVSQHLPKVAPHISTWTTLGSNRSRAITKITGA